MTSQPGDYHLEWMCALSDDVPTGWPRPGADRRASLRPWPDDGRTTRREGAPPARRRAPCRARRPIPDPKALSPARTDRNRTP